MWVVIVHDSPYLVRDEIGGINRVIVCAAPNSEVQATNMREQFAKQGLIAFAVKAEVVKGSG